MNGPTAAVLITAIIGLVLVLIVLIAVVASKRDRERNPTPNNYPWDDEAVPLQKDTYKGPEAHG